MRPRNGFTTIELTVSIVILAILAATAVPMLGDGSARRLARATDEIEKTLKMAQHVAITTGRHTYIKFDTANKRYEMYIDSIDTPGYGSRQQYADPITRAALFQVQLNSGDYAGVTITSASFGGRSEVEFDSLGKPYNGQGTALAATGSVVISCGGSSRTIQVYALTGLVKES